MDREKEEWTWEQHVAHARGEDWGEKLMKADEREATVLFIGAAIILGAPFISWLLSS